MSRIEDKVVAITGASSGIGEATALLLAERGAKVVLGARGVDRLKALVDRIAAAGGDVAYMPTDVKRRDDISNHVKLACERYGKLDVLLNNAGVMPVSPLDDLRVDDWNEMIDINRGWRQAARDDQFPWIRQDKLYGRCDKPADEDPARDLS